MGDASLETIKPPRKVNMAKYQKIVNNPYVEH
jgi:hypothetical protein